MSANRKRVAVLLLLLGLLGSASVGLAQTESPERERREVEPTTSEVIAAIKRRAQQILEARKAARRLRFSGEVSQLVGYESNPSNGTEHVGDTYVSTSTYLALSKKLTSTVTWQGTYSGSFDNYMEYGDGDYMSHTLTPTKLIWQPGRMWRIDAGADLNITYYPKSGASNYREFKPSVGIRQNLWGKWFHSVRHEWFTRDYISKKARDGSGNETEVDRKDTRNRVRYEVGTTWHDTLLKVKQEWYRHDSNDERTDFYDAGDYKVTASLNRALTKKLTIAPSYSFERKNYSKRTVTGITAEARYDDTHTWTLAGTYDFNNTWSVNPSFSYKWLDSNEPTGEFIDTTISGTVTARF